MLKRILLIGLVATSLVAMLETETRAVLNIGGAGAGGCFCVSSTGSCKLKTTCDRSRDQGTCDDVGTSTFCPIASLERSEFFAAAPGPEQTEICADTPSPEPIATFANTPSPEQIATFAALPNSEPRIILVAKPTTIEPAPSAYECSAFGAGGGNLESNPGITTCFFRPEKVAVHCMNPSGQDGGLGTPFSTTAILSESEVIDATNLFGKGKWFAASIFDQADLVVITPTGDVCKENGWEPILNTLTIFDVTIDIQANRCTDGTNCANTIEQPPTDRWIADCTVGTTFYNFNCTLREHCLDLLDEAARNACLIQIL